MYVRIHHSLFFTRHNKIPTIQMIHTPCQLSPIFFAMNSLFAYSQSIPIYSFLFANLTITSIYYHTTYSIPANILDKMAIVSVVSYGGYTFIQKLLYSQPFLSLSIFKYIHIFTILSTFLLTNYLYMYGKKTNRFCFSPNQHIANIYHSYLHFVSAIGHALIMLL
jgi:hypothetical protein